ncbi:MAG: AAA family ATPase [Planctomycetes bacterium]|nr:AAA family ATPase [Planctomycetota bacterium]
MQGRIIAFSGKGGSGKTTLASLVLRQLIRTGRKPILAVDADPNATLGMTLGVDVGGTIADLRDNMGRAAQTPGEISKQQLMDQWLNELLCEQAGFDLLTMGRPEGPKCYCYVNGLLRRYLNLLRKNYACILVDCEAGMEYLSRLVVDDVDTLVLVAEGTRVGLTTVRRIAHLTESLPMKVHRKLLAVNKLIPVCGDDDAGEARAGVLPATQLPELPGVEAVFEVPFDPDVANRCILGQAIDDAAGGQARPSVEALTNRCLGLTEVSIPDKSGLEGRPSGAAKEN